MTTAATATTEKTSWRDLYPPHPCAEIFPMMNDREFDALAQDIAANGLQQKILLVRQVAKNSGGQFAEGPLYQVSDGRNRLAALMKAGVTIPSHPDGWAAFPDGHKERIFQRRVPYCRRHCGARHQSEHPPAPFIEGTGRAAHR